MNWKFWQWYKGASLFGWRNKGDSLDYGRIENVAVAWEFAHEEAADRILARFEEERIKRHEQFERENFELESWLSSITDRSSSVNTRTQYGSRTGNPWEADSLAIPCVAVSRVSDAKARFTSYAPCVLPMYHKGDHELGGGKPWVEDEKPTPILVHEAIGEIYGPEDLKRLKRHLKDEAREAKRNARAKYDHIAELGEKYYPES